MRKRKKIIILMFGILIFLIIVGISFIFYIYHYHKTLQIANPSAVYCDKMGYTYLIGVGENGESLCIFPDNNSCTAWSFYKGECGQNWSYCIMHGYDIETRESVGLQGDPYSKVYSVCIDKNTRQDIGLVSELIHLEERLPSSVNKIA